MPYKHSGEIGDVWKHLPLCDVLEIETPKNYFETNSAYAEYQLEANMQNQYGIYHLFEQDGYELLVNSIYYKILSNICFVKENKYYGSPALAMTILNNSNTNFHFHDIEKEPLDNISNFSKKFGLSNKVITYHGDSISAFMQEDYRFDNNDFIFIDPYQPFDSNANGDSFFDVFIKAYRSKAKTMLWYGYDNLDGKNNILEKLQSISYEFDEAPIHTFDVWQKSMNNNSCKANPGVPGCGIAVSNLTDSSIYKIGEYLCSVGCLYRNKYYNGENASLCIGHLSL